MLPDPWAGVTPRRWQAEAFDAVIGAMRAGTRRPLVHAATGSGKSRLLGALSAACTGSVLVTTPTQALVEQLARTLAEHCGADRVGRCFQHAWEIDRDIVVSCIPSLPAVLDRRHEWGCWLADEAHRLEGRHARLTRDRLQASVMVGMTATPFRGDDRGLVLWDDLVYSYTSHQAITDGVLVPWRVVRSDVIADVDELTGQWVAQADGPGIVSATSIADAEATAKRLRPYGRALPIHGRLTREAQTERIEMLRTGTLQCLVHCQLLTEGIDLPWLRWLVLRRPVSSPVRLVQEVGRVLRAHPGKTEAVLYDPHDCLGSVGLVHGAQLEDVQKDKPPADPGESWQIPELEGLELFSGLPKSVAISALEGWAIDALMRLRAAGVAPPPRGDVNPSGPWRRKRASDKQLAAAQRCMWALQFLPTDTDRAVCELLLEDDRVRAGTASDVLSILFAVGRQRGTRGIRLPVLVNPYQSAT